MRDRIYYFFTGLLTLFCFNEMLLPVTTKQVLFYLPHDTQSVVQPFDNSSSSIVLVDDTELSSVSSLLYRMMTEEPNDTLHVSFLSPQLSQRLFKYGELQSKLSLRVDKTTCNVIPSGIDHLGNCNYYYADVLNKLVDFFPFSESVIIRTDRYCDEMLANKLIGSSNSTRDGLTSLKDLVIRTNNLSSDIPDIIYKIKVTDVNLIICLLPSSLAKIVFEVASRYELLDYSVVWFSIELNGHLKDMNTLWLPWQWIDLRMSTEQLKWNSLVKNMIKIKDAFLKSNGSLSGQSLQQIHVDQKSTDCNNKCLCINMFARNSSKEHSVEWGLISKWTINSGINVFPTANLLVRMIRTSISLVTLKIVTVIDDPITSYARHLYNAQDGGSCEQGLICRTAVKGLPENHLHKWENNCCIGMSIDLILLVSKELHFIPDVYIVEDGFYGGKDKNTSQWNGLVRDIQLHKADIAVAALTVTADRLEVVDFCEPYLQVNLGILVSTLQQSLNFINWEFLAPLSSELRVWILVTFILGTYLIYILENQHLVLQRIIDKSVLPRYQWREGFSYFSGLTFQRDLGGKNPQQYGARVTAVAFAFGMVIIMTTYTAVLTASKVSQSSSNPFLGFKDDRVMNPTSDFKYGTVSHTSMESYFKNSKDDTLKRMFQFMLNYNVNQSLEGIEMVRRGQLNAFIHETTFLTYHASKQSDCSLKIFGKAINKGGYAFSVPKDSAWKHLISQAVLKFKENEVIEEVYKKWFPAACAANSTGTEYEAVEINYFGGLIFILFIFLVISIVLLGGEHFCHRHHRRVINPLQEKVQVWRDTKAAERRNAIIDPNDISKLQQLHNSGMIGTTNKDADHSSSSDDDISEGEEEMIRMRLGRRNPGRQVQEERLSVTDSVQRTSLDSIGQYYASNTVRRGSRIDLGSVKKMSVRPSLNTTLEISETENSSVINPEHNNNDNDDDEYSMLSSSIECMARYPGEDTCSYESDGSCSRESLSSAHERAANINEIIREAFPHENEIIREAFPQQKQNIQENRLDNMKQGLAKNYNESDTKSEKSDDDDNTGQQNFSNFQLVQEVSVHHKWEDDGPETMDNGPTRKSSDHSITYGSPRTLSDHSITNGLTRKSSDHSITNGLTRKLSDHSITNGSTRKSSDYSLINGSTRKSSDHLITNRSTRKSSEHSLINGSTRKSSDHLITNRSTRKSSEHPIMNGSTRKSSDHSITNGSPRKSSDHSITNSSPRKLSDHSIMNGSTRKLSDHSMMNRSTRKSSDHSMMNESTSKSDHTIIDIMDRAASDEINGGDNDSNYFSANSINSVDRKEERELIHQ